MARELILLFLEHLVVYPRCRFDLDFAFYPFFFLLDIVRHLLIYAGAPRIEMCAESRGVPHQQSYLEFPIEYVIVKIVKPR